MTSHCCAATGLRAAIGQRSLRKKINLESGQGGPGAEGNVRILVFIELGCCLYTHLLPAPVGWSGNKDL